VTILLSLLRRVPVWLWAVVAVMAWGAYQRHAASAAAADLARARATAAADEAQALRASITETERRLSAQAEIASAASARLDGAPACA
jgi:hypothetical protein